MKKKGHWPVLLKQQRNGSNDLCKVVFTNDVGIQEVP